MKRSIALITGLLLCILIFSGCSRIDYSLPDDPIAFGLRSYSYNDETGAELAGFEYNGREYVFFGVIKGGILSDEVGECIGYIVSETNPEDKNDRVLKLTATDDFLMSYYVSGIMESPCFYRAADTRDKDIEIPEYIVDNGYRYWGGEN